MSVNFNFYKNAYNLNKLKNPLIVIHWDLQGKTNNLLGSEKQFYDKYPDFEIETYKKYNKQLESVNIISNEKILTHFWHHGIREKRIYKNVKNNCNLQEIIDNYNINNCIFSKENYYSDDIIKKCKVFNYIREGKALLIFNPTKNELIKIMNHDGYIYLLITDNKLQ